MCHSLCEFLLQRSVIQMTRAELLKVAQEIIRNPIEEYADSSGHGLIFTGIYEKRPMSVFLTNSKAIIAIAYNRVCYFTNGTDRQIAPRLRNFYEERNCNTRVYLYSEAKKSFTDDYGTESDSIARRISQHLDYSDVIPIPYRA